MMTNKPIVAEESVDAELKSGADATKIPVAFEIRNSAGGSLPPSIDTTTFTSSLTGRTKL